MFFKLAQRHRAVDSGQKYRRKPQLRALRSSYRVADRNAHGIGYRIPRPPDLRSRRAAVALRGENLTRRAQRQNNRFDQNNYTRLPSIKPATRSCAALLPAGRLQGAGRGGRGVPGVTEGTRSPELLLTPAASRAN